MFQLFLFNYFQQTQILNISRHAFVKTPRKNTVWTSPSVSLVRIQPTPRECQLYGLDDTYRSKFANFFNNKQLNFHCYILDLARQILSDECKQASNWFSGYIVCQVVKTQQTYDFERGQSLQIISLFSAHYRLLCTSNY